MRRSRHQRTPLRVDYRTAWSGHRSAIGKADRRQHDRNAGERMRLSAQKDAGRIQGAASSPVRELHKRLTCGLRQVRMPATRQIEDGYVSLTPVDIGLRRRARPGQNPCVNSEPGPVGHRPHRARPQDRRRIRCRSCSPAAGRVRSSTRTDGGSPPSGTHP